MHKNCVIYFCNKYLLKVAIFLYLDKIQVRLGGTISGNQVLLLVILRRPIYFDYKIEFVDMNGTVLDTVDGKKGERTFSHNLDVYRDTDVMARFKIGNITGPESDALTNATTTGMLIFK